MELNEGLMEPVSPSGQYFNSSVLSVSILAVLEIEVPITDIHVHATSLLKDLFLPINPRFSSVMVPSLSLSILCFRFYVVQFSLVYACGLKSTTTTSMLRPWPRDSDLEAAGNINDSQWWWWWWSRSAPCVWLGQLRQ
jgi:hypothetical protein